MNTQQENTNEKCECEVIFLSWKSKNKKKTSWTWYWTETKPNICINEAKELCGYKKKLHTTLYRQPGGHYRKE